MKIIKTAHFQQSLFNPSDYLEDDNLEDDLKYFDPNAGSIEKLLQHYNVKFHYVKFHDKQIIVADCNYGRKPSGKIVVDDNSIQDAYQWLYDLSENQLYDLIQPPEFSNTFWEDMPQNFVLYHGTKQQNVASILKNGLQPRCETRGISNKSTPCGIFTTPNLHTAQTYTYPNGSVVEIQVGKMKQDHVMPYVSIEQPIQEAELREIVANKLQIYDFQQDVENSLDHDTIIFFQPIPPQFLQLHKR